MADNQLHIITTVLEKLDGSSRPPMRSDRVFPAQRADAVFRDLAELILREITLRRRDKTVDLFEMMLDEAADPNRN